MVSLVTSQHSAKMGVSSEAGLLIQPCFLTHFCADQLSLFLLLKPCEFKKPVRAHLEFIYQASNTQGQSEIGDTGRWQVVQLCEKRASQEQPPSPKDV